MLGVVELLGMLPVILVAVHGMDLVQLEPAHTTRFCAPRLRREFCGTSLPQPVWKPDAKFAFHLLLVTGGIYCWISE